MSLMAACSEKMAFVVLPVLLAQFLAVYHKSQTNHPSENIFKVTSFPLTFPGALCYQHVEQAFLLLVLFPTSESLFHTLRH